MSIEHGTYQPPALQRSAMWGCTQDLYGISIAVIVHSLDPSISTRLIPPSFAAKSSEL